MTEAQIFVAACEANQDTIDTLPIDHPLRNAYVEGLADGVRFARNGRRAVAQRRSPG
ncbi:MAG TPA: hypothetical protein VGI19_18640 [Candidatus Cybelea sp.]|jgi:hypothetical protein